LNKELHYFAGGNTAKGFVHFFDSNFQDLQRLFILKGGPGTGKSSMIKSIGQEWLDSGYFVEWIHCSSAPDSLDAMILPELKVGIVDGTNPHVIEPKYPGVVDDYVNLGEAWDRSRLLTQKDEIIALSNQIKEGFQKAYHSLAQGLALHDDLEKIYINEMNFEKANKLAERWVKQLIPEKSHSKSGEKRVFKRFLGATTPIGPIDYVDSLTEGLHRYFIKGRAGTGKSTLLKKIANAAKDKGYDVEIYHCGFDPNSLDMVIVRELNFAIFDSTAPHEYFPSKNTDAIIDLYELLITPGTDEKYAEEIKRATISYKSKMSEGINHLAKTKELRDQLEHIYTQAMDFTSVDKIRDKINEEIKSLAK
jgi:hypothetical protein